MDFAFTPAQEAIRHEIRAWLDEALPPAARDTSRRVFGSLDEEFAYLTAWQRRQFEAGWVGLQWPREYGGRGLTLMEQAICQEELARARAPQLANRVGINLVGPTLFTHGTEAQKRRYLSRILDAGDIWCQLFSEPDAGSDLAALRTRAEPDGDAFVVSGQKVWTSYAQYARWGILLARTDATVPRHRGLSYFILDMKSPGITIRPLRQITGSDEFNEVFLDAVRVPRENLVGELNHGWSIALTTLAHERGTAFPFKEQVIHKIAVDELVELAKGWRVGQRGAAASADACYRQRIAQSFIEVEIMRLHNYRMMTKLDRGEMPGPESSIVKLFWADLTQHLHDTALEILGPHGVAGRDADWPAPTARWQSSFLWARAGSIAGGTSEVQRNIIAERLLGLPRG
jgi:alkylation response protein AidB-like acyl-CoA dehydrogenase